MTARNGLEQRHAPAKRLTGTLRLDPKPDARDPAILLRSELAIRQAAKMEAIEVLAGGIAHDFNNRLTVILGNLELLEAEVGDSAEALSLIRDARLAAENGSGLARQLLAIARPQIQDRNLNDVNDVINCLENVLGHCLGKSARLHVSLKKDLPQVVFDSSGLEDVLVNLTMNARDAMDAGDSLTIETDSVWLDSEQLLDKPDLAPGMYAMIAFTDTGHGMSAAVRERAFEPYYTTKGEAGTGLGLSMVYSFVRRWNGHVSIYSEVGHGTCVKIYIPETTSAAEATVPALSGTDKVTSRFPGRTVVVVEDQAQIRDIASKVLHDMGCEVHSFSEAQEALKYLEAGPDVDLLFTDIVTGNGLDGIGLAALAKRVRPAMKIIFTSGYTRSGPFARRLPADDDYVTKPWSRHSIAAAMTQAFSTDDGAMGAADKEWNGRPAAAMAG
jgi:signal transduction histidine kinase/CheY-like chemotaxis protein